MRSSSDDVSAPAARAVPLAIRTHPKLCAADHFTFVPNDVITFKGITLTRIRASRDMPFHHVRAGELGGYLECADNLTEEAWVGGDAYVFGTARLRERSRTDGSSRVLDSELSGTARAAGCAIIGPNSQMRGNTYAYGSARIIGTRLAGDVRIGSGLVVGEDLSDLRFQRIRTVP